jgi:hypothetical protein
MRTFVFSLMNNEHDETLCTQNKRKKKIKYGFGCRLHLRLIAAPSITRADTSAVPRQLPPHSQPMSDASPGGDTLGLDMIWLTAA